MKLRAVQIAVTTHQAKNRSPSNQLPDSSRPGKSSKLQQQATEPYQHRGPKTKKPNRLSIAHCKDESGEGTLKVPDKAVINSGAARGEITPPDTLSDWDFAACLHNLN
jgi:hypothetical protein